MRHAWALTGWIEDGMDQVYPNTDSHYEGARISVTAGAELEVIDFLLEPSERR